MMQIDKTLVSDDLLEKEFVCNLQQCKGACCVEGEAGAPLEEEELKELEKNFEAIRPYLNQKGLTEIDSKACMLKDGMENGKPLSLKEKNVFIPFLMIKDMLPAE